MVTLVGLIGIVRTMDVSNGTCGSSCKALVKESKAHVTESSASAPTSPSLLCGTIPKVFQIALFCKSPFVTDGYNCVQCSK